MTAAEEIDAIIRETADWRGETLARLRGGIKAADPAVVEEVKWKKPSLPSGVPVWSHDGIICVANTLKKAVRLTFFKGALMSDQGKLFNTRLDSKSVRAVDYGEGVPIDEAALRAVVLEAIALNEAKTKPGR